MSILTPPSDFHAVAAACLFREDCGYTEEQILTWLGVTLEHAQIACGHLGHEYESNDTGRCCMFCGVPDDRGYDDEW